MKAVMYHYVRPVPHGLPHFRYLHVDNFQRQLDWMEENGGLLSRDAFEHALAGKQIASGHVLTFDDGFADHYEHVFPILKARKAWGIFYVPAGIFTSPRMLDVHRVHLILGRHGGTRALESLRHSFSDDFLRAEFVAQFRDAVYRSQSNDTATEEFKKILNYYVQPERKTFLLDALMAELFDSGQEARIKQSFYATPAQLRQMHTDGMMIGSHSMTHPVMSQISPEDQEAEITQSFGALQAILGAPIETFCYPFGGFHTFSRETENLLARHGCRFAFNVEPRDITDPDLARRPQALPRYDCNLFPHGQAHLGLTPPLGQRP